MIYLFSKNLNVISLMARDLVLFFPYVFLFLKVFFMISW